MKQFMNLSIGVVCLAARLSIGVPASLAQTDTVQDGLNIVGVGLAKDPYFICARPNGDVFQRVPTSVPWDVAPTYLGNFFFGQAVPSDFVSGFHVATYGAGNLPGLYYASSTGDVYYNQGPIQVPPTHLGNFFFDGPVPDDFQEGFQIVGQTNSNEPVFYYTSPDGDVWRQGLTGPWEGPPAYQGNFFNEPPLPTSRSTIGGVKAKYR